MASQIAAGGIVTSSRIVLIDDNNDFLEVSQEFLEAFEGLEVIGKATSGQQALEMLYNVSPNLLIVDVSMPGMNGLELTQEIKKRWPHLQVIILTLLDTPQHRQAALQAGADAFVTKSSMDNDLVPTIRNLQSSPGHNSGG